MWATRQLGLYWQQECGIGYRGHVFMTSKQFESLATHSKISHVVQTDAYKQWHSCRRSSKRCHWLRTFKCCQPMQVCQVIMVETAVMPTYEVLLSWVEKLKTDILSLKCSIFFGNRPFESDKPHLTERCKKTGTSITVLACYQHGQFRSWNREVEELKVVFSSRMKAYIWILTIHEWNSVLVHHALVLTKTSSSEINAKKHQWIKSAFRRHTT